VAGCRGVVALDSAISAEEARGGSESELQERTRSAAANAPVSIQVSDGIAILRGQVESPAALDTVIAAIERVPGIKGIRSDVTFSGQAFGA